MKLLIIGVFDRRSSNTSMAYGFELIKDIDVIRYMYRQRQAQLKNDPYQRDAELLKICYKERPELIIFCKGSTIDSRVIRGCNLIGKTFLWWMDSNEHTLKKSEHIERIKLCNIVAVSTWNVLDLLKSYRDDIYFLNDGYDPQADYPITGLEYKWDVLFLGELYGTRVDRFEKLKDLAKQKKFCLKNITTAYGNDHSTEVAQTKINLNFSTAGIIPDAGPSARIYKIMACRGFLLTETFPYLSKYGFVPGKDFAVFDGDDDLERKIDYYLEHEDERLRIAENGWKRVQPYTRYRLAQKILELVGLGKYAQ